MRATIHSEGIAVVPPPIGAAKLPAAASRSSTRSLQLALAALLVLAGLYAFRAQLTDNWMLWTQDPLRCIGICLPPLSLWLMWRSTSWKDWSTAKGSWWGLLLMVAAMTAAILSTYLPLEVNLQVGAADDSSRAYISFVPNGVRFFAYFSGAVLLFGGPRTWRKAWFAVAIWLFANPVPQAFQALVDLPSQALGAQTARAFAALIGVPVDGNALKLMFSQDLGIFIAPGCNGLRGAVTMGYLALVIGYLRQMPWRRWLVFVTAAIALAYLFNLIRLCAVIGYYWVALRVPSLGRYGTEIDYVIGGVLFAAAAWFLFRQLPRRAVT